MYRRENNRTRSPLLGSPSQSNPIKCRKTNPLPQKPRTKAIKRIFNNGIRSTIYGTCVCAGTKVTEKWLTYFLLFYAGDLQVRLHFQ